jgi:MFS family permease
MAATKTKHDDNISLCFPTDDLPRRLRKGPYVKTSISPVVTRRIMMTLFASQSLASAAFVANATVNSIVGAELSGDPGLAGLPGTLLLIGAACAAYPAGRLMHRIGWRPGLTLGLCIGLIGMLIGGIAVVIHSFFWFLLSLVLIGIARGVTDLSRYAAADASLPSQRGKMISAVVWAGTIGAIVGPAAVAPLGSLVTRLNFDPLSGAMIGGIILFAVSAILLILFLRPDPRDVARTLAVENIENRPADFQARGLITILRQPMARLAVTAMITGQVVMVLVMGVTSLHMYNHQHDLGNVSLVISLHVLGMFGLSPLTGLLIVRMGRVPTIILGAGLLMMGALLAPMSVLLGWLALAMFLVGLGWNVCYIGGSSLLTESVAASERGKVQGASDLMVNLTSAVSSLGSGFILAGPGYTFLCLLSAALSLVPIALSGWRGFVMTRRAGDVSLN